jgi:hypothetical protein
MIGISELFKRIQGARAREILIRTSIQDSIKKYTGADIPLEAISFSSDSIVLKNITSSLRSAIYIKKGAIIEEINRNQDARKVTDIR